MLPIHITVGSERYLLVRRGTTPGDDDRFEPTTTAKARAVLRAALSRPKTPLIKRLASALHLHGADAEQVKAMALGMLGTGSSMLPGAGGGLPGDLMLLRVRPVKVERLEKRAKPEAEAPPPPPDQPVEEEEEEEPPPAKTTIRVSLFFDGTANNRWNTYARLLKMQAHKDHKDDGSYANDFTNVSHLETCYVGDTSFDHHYSIYIEGIGTVNLDGDSTYGQAVGMGDTGVVGKVKRGYNELFNSIKGLGIPKDVIIEKIHLDTFGFSRGAAAARHFVHYVLKKDKLKPKIEKLGYTVGELKINFVGLYDTVASYGVKHSNDTSDLSLDAVKNAMKVAHLAAAEEHRVNFRLTDIQSAGKKGIEIYMPGVHSDIGGGYTDNYEEKDLQILDIDTAWTTQKHKDRLAKEAKWLQTTGWYTKAEIDKPNWWNELKVTRKNIRNGYARIPLQKMAEFAEQTGLTFPSLVSRHPIPGDLAGVKADIEAHIAGHLGGDKSTAEFWLAKTSARYKALRHKYLHFSAHYNMVNNPQWDSAGMMKGKRKRIVQKG